MRLRALIQCLTTTNTAAAAIHPPAYGADVQDGQAGQGSISSANVSLSVADAYGDMCEIGSVIRRVNTTLVLFSSCTPCSRPPPAGPCSFCATEDSHFGLWIFRSDTLSVLRRRFNQWPIAEEIVAMNQSHCPIPTTTPRLLVSHTAESCAGRVAPTVGARMVTAASVVAGTMRKWECQLWQQLV